MDKMTQFFAGVMGIGKWDESRCRICGWPLVEKIEDGCTKESCSMRPVPDKRADEMTLTPSLNDPDFRKWWEEHEPDVWNNYICHEHSVLFPQDDFDWFDILEAQLNLPNFYTYLKQHWQEWGYEDCGYKQHCKNDCQIYDYCPLMPDAAKMSVCTGCICKYPQIKKIMEGE